MNDAMNIAKRKELDENGPIFLYKASMPFNVARNPAFIEAVKATSFHGLNTIRLPTINSGLSS